MEAQLISNDILYTRTESHERVPDDSRFEFDMVFEASENRGVFAQGFMSVGNNVFTATDLGFGASNVIGTLFDKLENKLKQFNSRTRMSSTPQSNKTEL